VSVCLCVTRQFRVLIHRRNRLGQLDSENGIWPGQSDSKTRQRAHERSRKNQATSARERDLTVREKERHYFYYGNFMWANLTLIKLLVRPSVRL
jgi:hypothetical protein